MRTNRKCPGIQHETKNKQRIPGISKASTRLLQIPDLSLAEHHSTGSSWPGNPAMVRLELIAPEKSSDGTEEKSWHVWGTKLKLHPAHFEFFEQSSQQSGQSKAEIREIGTPGQFKLFLVLH